MECTKAVLANFSYESLLDLLDQSSSDLAGSLVPRPFFTRYTRSRDLAGRRGGGGGGFATPCCTFS